MSIIIISKLKVFEKTLSQNPREREISRGHEAEHLWSSLCAEVTKENSNQQYIFPAAMG